MERAAVLKFRTEIQELRNKIVAAEKAGDDALLKTHSDEMMQLQNEYQALLKHIDKNRKSFLPGLVKRELARLHDLKMGRVRGIVLDTDLMNQKYFTGKVPPFEASTVGYVIESSGELEVARGWGNPTGEFGGFYSAPRHSAILAPEETRELLATPSANTHTDWSFVKIPKNDLLVLGLTAAQRTTTGEDKVGWGFGGNGGELQYWRPTDFHLGGKKITQAYLSSKDVRLQMKVSIISEEIRRIQAAIIPHRDHFYKLEYFYADALTELSRLRSEKKHSEDVLKKEEETIRDYFRAYTKFSLEERIPRYQEAFLQAPTHNMGRWGAIILDYRRLLSESESLLLKLYKGHPRWPGIAFDEAKTLMLPLKEFFEKEKAAAILTATSPMQLAYKALTLEQEP